MNERSECVYKINKKLLLITMLGMFIFSCANVSATLDVKNFDEDVGRYGQIEINDWLFLNKIDYRLTDYDSSLINVYAEGEYTAHKKTHLFTGIFYRDILGSRGELKNAEFYIWNEENETRWNPIYEHQNCYNDTNYTEEEALFYSPRISDGGIERCDNALISNESYEVDISGWVSYKKGDDIKEGDGRWRIEGERPLNVEVDFILEGHNKEFTEWAWWNNSFGYKREIVISETSGASLINYSTLLNITYSSGMQTDFSDLRFTNLDEDIELGYWIDSKVDSTSAYVWVNVPTITASSNTSIYMYYGNGEVSSESSGDNAFLFYDDFSSVDLAKWYENSGSLTVSGGNAIINNDDINGKIAFLNPYIFELNMSTTGREVGMQLRDDYTSSATTDERAEYGDITSFTGYARTVHLGTATISSTGLAWGATWTKKSIATISSSSTKFFSDDVLDYSITTNIPTNALYPNMRSWTGQTMSVDWYRVRTYSSSDPIYFVGAEQSSNTPPNITANTTKPDKVLHNTDYLVNLTIEDLDVGNTITGYTQFYVNGTTAGAEQSTIVVNGTNTLVATLSSGNFTGGDNLTAQVWAGDGTVNTTKVNLTSSMVALAPLVTTLTEYPTDPSIYNQSAIYNFNATITDNGILDDIIFEFDGTNYTASNMSADIFNVSFTNLSVGVYNYRWFANDSEGNINNSATGSYTINQAIPEGNLTSTLGWSINETQEVTIGLVESQVGDGDVVYIVSRDNVAKGTGETWSPPYGTYYYVLNTTGGVNWTENISMDTQTLTVSDNINPLLVIDFPVNGSGYNSVRTELNYTATDTNLNTCWYSLNGGLANQTVTCGDDVTGLDSGQGTSTWQFWVNDSDNNINTTTTTFFVDTVSPLVTNLVELPADPATYSQTTIYHFNATITDASSSLDDIIFEFNGTNYTATNMSADIFNVSFTNLSAGVYNYRWYANDSSGNINNSVTGSYTVNQEASQTSLLFSVPSPQTYGVAMTPTCSILVGDGSGVLEMDGNVITSGAAITLGANTYFFNCSLTETINYTGSMNTSSYTINKAIPIGSLTSNLGWNINEGQEVTIGLSESQSNDGDVIYIVHRDNVEKGTGETWYPAYGTYTYLLNTTGGANWTVNSTMHIVDLVVNDNINPNIVIDFPVDGAEYNSVITELNYTANDTNLNTCWYSLDGGLANTTVTCGDNVIGLDSGAGYSTWQFWVNDSDNNINTTTTTFFADPYGPNVTDLAEYPSDPATYSQEIIYNFNATIVDGGRLDDIIFEFNGTNYTATNMSADIFNVSFTNLSAGVYSYRWYANDTAGNINNSATGVYTINKAIPNLTVNGTTPIIYGTATDFSGSGCPLELTCSLDINNTVYGAGTISANYSTPGNENYTSAYANFTITINKASLTGSITGTSPINYTTAANITANETNNNDSDVIYIFHRDDVIISNPDTTTLGAGTYIYTYNSTGGANYSSNVSIVNFTLTIDKADGEVYAYVSNRRANYLGNNLTARNEYLNGSLNVGLGDISMYFDNSLIGSGAPPLFDVRDFPLGSYYFNVTYDGNDNYTSDEEHYSINISVWFLSNLTGVFNLNIGSGDDAYDISGNSNNGTIEGATWGDDGIDVTLIDDYDYSVNNNSGLFVLLNDALDMTFIEINYVYFKYKSNTLEFIITRLLPGLLLMLVLVMIFRLFTSRYIYQREDEYLYDY